MVDPGTKKTTTWAFAQTLGLVLGQEDSQRRRVMTEERALRGASPEVSRTGGKVKAPGLEERRVEQDVVAEERARRKPRRPVARAVPSALATRTPREVPDVAKGARGDRAARFDVHERNF